MVIFLLGLTLYRLKLLMIENANEKQLKYVEDL